MKKTLLTAVFYAFTLTAAYADAPPPTGAQEFAQRKAMILQRMGERMAEMQKRQACVKAAANPEALRGCAPMGREGGPMMGGPGGPGQR